MPVAAMQGKLGRGRNQPTLALMASIEETFQAALADHKASRLPAATEGYGWVAGQRWLR